MPDDLKASWKAHGNRHSVAHCAQGIAFLSLELWGWQVADDPSALWPEGMGLQPRGLPQGSWQKGPPGNVFLSSTDLEEQEEPGTPGVFVRKLSPRDGQLCPSSISEAMTASRAQPLGQLPATGLSVSHTGLIMGHWLQIQSPGSQTHRSRLQERPENLHLNQCPW